MEKEINRCIEASAEAYVKGDLSESLEKAKEATNKDRSLRKLRENQNTLDQINIDLTYSVCFNLANINQANQLYSEALNTYTLIVKNKQ